jgi:hypothetical protein
MQLSKSLSWELRSETKQDSGASARPMGARGLLELEHNWIRVSGYIY